MATTKAQLELLLEEARTQLEETACERDTLQARVDAGIAAYKTLRGECERLREQLVAKHVVIVKPRREPVAVTTRFYRGGQLWEKTRVGNVATERLVEETVAV